MPDPAALAVDFLRTTNWAQARQFCAEHPEVLSPAVDQALAGLAHQFDTEGDPESAAIVSRARTALAGCRQNGIPLGFADAELDQAQRELASATGPDRAELLAGVGRAWYGRFEVTGDRTDLDQAVLFAEQAVAVAPGSYVALADLAGVEETRYRRFSELGDLARMADHQQAAVDAGYDAPRGHRYELAVRLAVRLTLRAGVLQRYGFLAGDAAVAELTRAVEAARTALELAGPDSRQRYDALAALIDALSQRYRTGGSLADLSSGISANQELIAGWPDSPRATAAWRSLAYALAVRSERSGQPEDLRQAVAALGHWLDQTPVETPGRAVVVGDLERWQAQLAQGSP
jgi:hypothetical protein